MSANISEIINVSHALNYQSLNNSNANSTFFSLSNYNRIMFVVDSAGCAGKLNIELWQSTDTTAANATSMSANISNVNITAANTTAKIEVRAPQLDIANSYYYIGIRVTEVNTAASNCSATAIRYPARYPQSNLNMS